MAVKVSFPAPSLFFWAIDLGVHACADIRYTAKGVGTSRWPRRMGYVSGNMPGRRYMGMIVGKLQMEQWVHSHREREGKKHDTNRTRDRWSMRNIQDRSFPGGYLGSFRLRTPTGTFFFLAMHHQEVCEALSFSFYALVLFSFVYYLIFALYSSQVSAVVEGATLLFRLGDPRSIFHTVHRTRKETGR